MDWHHYRRFAPNFAAITSTLHALTRKNVIFEWTDACQRAFDQLKQKLTTAPVLVFPAFRIEFILRAVWDLDLSCLRSRKMVWCISLLMLHDLSIRTSETMLSPNWRHRQLCGQLVIFACTCWDVIQLSLLITLPVSLCWVRHDLLARLCTGR